MKFLSIVGIGLSVVFCCLLLALVAETYYLLWWKRSITERQIQENYTNPIQDSHERGTTEDINAHESETGFRLHASSHYKDLYLKAMDENRVEAGLVMGPPTFLFTIKEETKEELESEDGKAKAESRRLSDLLRNENGPYEISTIRSSPSPKFEFLRDAEDKLRKKTAMEATLW